MRLRSGGRLIDIGCGGGRHSFEAFRRGCRVVALDRSASDLNLAAGTLTAMAEAGEAPSAATFETVRGDACCLPFGDDQFDHAIAAEVLEHIPDDERAIAEMARVLKPGGTAAVSVPRWFPERLCWVLSDVYHQNEGGHVRIYRGSQLIQKLKVAGLNVVGCAHAHALHSPYWWIKCAVGPANERAVLPRLYHRLLVWDIVRRPITVRLLEQTLNPVIGKSLVIYLEKAC
jgi:SAM-dependent methyltransferase